MKLRDCTHFHKSYIRRRNGKHNKRNLCLAQETPASRHVMRLPPAKLLLNQSKYHRLWFRHHDISQTLGSTIKASFLYRTNSGKCFSFQFLSRLYKILSHARFSSSSYIILEHPTPKSIRLKEGVLACV